MILIHGSTEQEKPGVCKTRDLHINGHGAPPQDRVPHTIVTTGQRTVELSVLGPAIRIYLRRHGRLYPPSGRYVIKVPEAALDKIGLDDTFVKGS